MKKYLSLLFLSLLMASCINIDDIKKQLASDPKDPSFEDVMIPADFKWSIHRDITVDVSVADGYDSKYNYAIQIFDVIPSQEWEMCDSCQVGGQCLKNCLESPDFVPMQLNLLNRGVASGNSPYTSKITIPASRKQIAIAQITPTRDTSYVFLTIDSLSNSVGYQFKNTASVSPSNVKQRAAQDGITVPSDAITLVRNMNLEAGKSYYIPAGVTINHIQNWGANDVSIYIDGTLSFPQPANINCSMNFYIMGPTDDTQEEPRGRIVSNKDVNISGKVSIYNYGYIDVPNLKLESKTGVYIENYYKIKTRNFYARETSEIKNYGRIECDGLFEVKHNANLITYANSDVVAKNMIVCPENGGIKMEAQSMIDIENNFTLGERATIEGADSGNGVVRVGGSVGVSGRSQCEGNFVLDVDPDNIKGEHGFAGFTDQDVIIGNPGKDVICIPIGPFNYTGYNCDGTEPTLPPDEDGIVFYKSIYTVAFEDNYPLVGDMDLNDVVIDWKIGTKMNASNQVTEIVLRTSVKAVGASKQIAAAIKVNGLSNIASVSLSKQPAGGFGQYFEIANGLETGVNETVIPLFENISQLFGMAPKELADAGYVNVQHQDLSGAPFSKYEPYTFDVNIALSSPVENTVTKTMFDFFLVNAGNADLRQEVHKFGCIATSKSNNAILFTNNQTVWGIELGDGFRYPLEYNAINKAYSDFYKWVESGGKTNLDWYLSPNKQYIY